MSDTAYYINSMTKNVLAFSDEELKEIGDLLVMKRLDLFFKFSPLMASVDLLRKSLDFTKESEQVAEEVTV